MLTIVTTCPEPSLSKDTERFFLQFPARAANFKTMVDCVGGQQQLEQHTSTHPPCEAGSVLRNRLRLFSFLDEISLLIHPPLGLAVLIAEMTQYFLTCRASISVQPG